MSDRLKSWLGTFILPEDVPTAGEVCLSILSIRPQFRRSGVGTAVIKSLKKVLSAQGFRFALGPVYLANIPALRFWTRLGFTEIVPPSR